MGKSPGKWIKTLLFGKKASKSNLSKGREVSKTANEKEALVAATVHVADLSEDPPLISHPAPDTTDKNGGNSELEKGVTVNLLRDGVVSLPGNQDADMHGTNGSGAPNDPERNRKVQAATKAQAAFRGYLARRAFRALRGIIRLQALVRGHLVRRQAAATLYCLQGIVKLQALVRGLRVRLSDIGLEVHKKYTLRNPLDAKHSKCLGEDKSTRTEKLSANAFVSKLLASLPNVIPLRLQYGPEEPNSAWNWLELWTSSRFWEPLAQPKRVLDSKSQRKQGNFQSVEIKSGRPKRSVRRAPTANVDNGSKHSTFGSEKPKRSLGKVSSHPVDSVQDDPQHELDKVKRNLRKVSKSAMEVSNPSEVETEKSKHSLRKVSSCPAPDVLDQGMSDSAGNLKDTTVGVHKQPDVETTRKLLAADGSVDVLHDDHPAVELQPLESSGKDENIPFMNRELNSKEDKTSNENQKSSRRSASFPAKQEYPENGLQNSPTLPSYMAATKSAKAKLREQGSPRLSQDGTEKDGFTRRHSLPSFTNGKSSLSPQMQRLVQASGKGGVRSDRSLLSSRDVNDKVIQAEWRR